MTPERRKKIEQVLNRRQPSLVVVLENVDDSHNVGAILRSCDAFGVHDVHLLYHNGNSKVKSMPRAKSWGQKSKLIRMPRLNEIKSKSAASAGKWLRFTKWDSPKKLVQELKKKKFLIAATALGKKSKDPAHVDLTLPIALALGNEHDGVSPEMQKLSDLRLSIPMQGMVQSFNVSVAAALLLYEAFRQREKKGMYKEAQMKKGERERILKKWTR